jgi:WD40 repeat protein
VDVNSVSFSESSALVLTAAADSTVALWDVGTGRRRGLLRAGDGGAAAVMCAHMLGAAVAGGCVDRTVQVWDVATERARAALTGHSGKVFAVQWASDGRTLLSAGADRAVKLWDTVSGRCVRSVTTPSIVNGAVLSGDGLVVATAHQDGGVRLWDVRTGAALAENKTAHAAAATDVRVAAGGGEAGALVLSMSRDNSLALLHGRTLVGVGDDRGGSAGSLRHPSFRVAVNWADASLSPRPLPPEAVRRASATGLAAAAARGGGAPAGADLVPHFVAAAGSVDGSVHMWDTATAAWLGALRGAHRAGAAVTSVAWAPDGRRLASVDADGVLVLWA